MPEGRVMALPERVPAFDVTGWVLRISAAMVFLAVGLTKFKGDSYWVHLFADIGVGDWFRYLTGVLQVAGSVCFLIPRMVHLAATLAGATMAGAVIVHMLVLDTGLSGAVFPFALLVFIAFVAARRPE